MHNAGAREVAVAVSELHEGVHGVRTAAAIAQQECEELRAAARGCPQQDGRAGGCRAVAVSGKYKNKVDELLDS